MTMQNGEMLPLRLMISADATLLVVSATHEASVREYIYQPPAELSDNGKQF